MTDRFVIGSELDDTKHVELDKSVGTGKVTVPVTIYDNAGNQVNLASGLVPNRYDSLVLGYNSSNVLISVTYKLATVVVATLTLTYDSSGNLTQIVKT